MRQEKIILSLVMLVLVLSIILMTSIGYAAETGNSLKISDNPLLIVEQDDFKIEFDIKAICCSLIVLMFVMFTYYINNIYLNIVSLIISIIFAYFLNIKSISLIFDFVKKKFVK